MYRTRTLTPGNAHPTFRIACAALAAAAALLLCGVHVMASEAAPTPATKPEASIPFVNHGGLRDYDVRDDDGIYLQSASGHWFYGKFFSRCLGIRFAEAIKVLTGSSDTLDRWSRIESRDSGTCLLTSLTESDPPAGHKPKAPETKAP